MIRNPLHAVRLIPFPNDGSLVPSIKWRQTVSIHRIIAHIQLPPSKPGNTPLLQGTGDRRWKGGEPVEFGFGEFGPVDGSVFDGCGMSGFVEGEGGGGAGVVD